MSIVRHGVRGTTESKHAHSVYQKLLTLLLQEIEMCLKLKKYSSKNGLTS